MTALLGKDSLVRSGAGHPPDSGAATPAGAATRRLVNGSVHSWQLSTGAYGPGTRFTVLLAGCPLTCLYCHNPEALRTRNGRRASADELVEEAARHRTLIAADGGGATVSGGEPLLQPVFTGELLHRFKYELGYHTVLDTSGFLGARAGNALLRDVDLVLLDIKSWRRDTYRRVTGRDLIPTVAFARRLARLGNEVRVRFVLVPGLTDAEENVTGIARFAASLGNVTGVDVIPYHPARTSGGEAIVRARPLRHTSAPTEEQVATARAVFTAHGLNAT
ncbi:radical SAM protein [Streptomyces sp. BBFR102]|uniref:radical SAM protein n=1 Tax=Streptomyces sp. BBFR102 TaxID=3448171 RepID=UPI003F52E609